MAAGEPADHSKAPAPRDLTAQLGAAATAPATPAPNDTIKTLRGLRTIHGNFSAQEIPEEVLQTIIQASVRAADASNMQCYSIVVVRDREMMKQVCGYRGSRMLVYFADHNRLKASARSLGHAHEPNGITSLITALVDTALAAQTAAIAARSLGVDYLLTNGVHRGDMGRLWKLLDLPPSHCFPVIALVLGYPKEEPAYLKGRLDGPGVVHEEKYHHLTAAETEEITRTYDDESRHLGLDYGGNWKADGHKHYLDWMFTAWMKRNPRPAGQPDPMQELVKRLGYLEG